MITFDAVGDFPFNYVISRDDWTLLETLVSYNNEAKETSVSVYALGISRGTEVIAGALGDRDIFTHHLAAN